VDGSAAPELIAATTYEGDVAFGKMLAKLKRATALDNLRNEYLLHRRIHRWLLDAEEVPDVESLNARVYDELFLTPKSDPWLGLLPGDAYTALPKDGVQPAKQ